MSKIKLADFYYGSVLSMLFSNKITPLLVESDKDRQVYDFVTNNIDFRLYIKYRTDKKDIKKEDYNSWLFSFTDKDIYEINNYMNSNKKLVLALICGVKDLKESEIAFLNEDDIKKVIELNKNSITISRIKNERAFRVSIGGGRGNSLQIKANRFHELLEGRI